jgi:hypothetical protein
VINKADNKESSDCLCADNDYDILKGVRCMVRKYGVISALLLGCMLLPGIPKPGCAAMSDMMYETADFFSDIGDAMRAADRARDVFYQHRTGPDAARYEQEWRDYEYKLEEARINRMAREARLTPHDIRGMRDEGHDWKVISDRYRIDPRKMGYGHRGPHGYDRDHDRDMHRYIYKKDHPGKRPGKGQGPGKDHPGKGPGKGKGPDKDHPGKGPGKDHPGKARGHYKGTPDGPPGQYKKN